MHHLVKFCANRSRRCRDMAVFVFFFTMAAVRHLGFSKVGNFNCPYPSEVQNASSYRILCKSVKPLRKYGRLQFFKMAAVRHLGFKKNKILTAHALRRAKMHYRAKFCAYRSRRCRDMAVFVFLKMAAVCHLGFVIRVFEPRRSVFWWSLSLCKIWLESVQYFR